MKIVFFSRQVFIGNICNISIDKLRSYCETYGTITELTLNRDKENNVKNFSLYRIDFF